MLISAAIFAQNETQFLNITPVPDSKNNSRETTVILYEGTDINPASLDEDYISVSGTISGEINGELILARDGRTIIFRPEQKYYPGETISVEVSNDLMTKSGKQISGVSFSFGVTELEKRLDPYIYLKDQYMEEFPERYRESAAKTNDDPPANFPSIRTEVPGETADGYVFMNVSRDIEGVGFFIMAMQNDGTPAYFKELPHDYSYDFKVQENGRYTYAHLFEHHSYTGGGDVTHYVMDESFTVIDSFQMKNGYVAEAHDFKLLANGHALLFGYDLQKMDLRYLGGYPNALVAGTVIQELDQDKNVVFQWRSWDHYALEDSKLKRLTTSAFDPVHINSIIIDTDKNIVVTSNGHSEVTKISRESGEMIWRWGGKKNQFTFIGENAEWADGLHNISRLENGHFLFLDNTAVGSDLTARAVEYEVDEVNKTATLVWQYAPVKPALAVRRGSAQRLPNGNTIIGWGSASDNDSLAVTEVTPDGEEVFRLYFNHVGMASYRAFRFPVTDYAPAADYTEYEVAAGNTYELGETNNLTGVTITIQTLTGENYNEFSAKRTNFAPLEPQFLGKAPHVMPMRIFTYQTGISSSTYSLKFDAAFFGIENASEYLVYYRQFEDNGVFEPLSTTYNQVTGEIIGAASGFGEFILARPDFASQTFKPVPFAPSMDELVNQSLSVTFRWNPIGYVNSYKLQLSNLSDFSNLIIDEDYLEEAIYSFADPQDNTTYYWRVKTINDVGESEWSDVYTFDAVPPYVKISTPNGGEELQRGINHFIVWEDNLSEDVEVKITPAASEQWQLLDVSPSTGGYRWSIPSDYPLGVYKVKVNSVIDTTIFSLSESSFSIIDTVTSVKSDFVEVENYSLLQNYPNPFNPSTVITFDMPEKSNVVLEIFAVTGELIETLVNSELPSGRHSVKFNASGYTSGIYIYRLTTGSFSASQKMMILK